MKMYNKINRLLIVFALLFFTCENEETLIITQPDAAFELQEPGISSINLNFGLPTNPALTLTWNDDVTGSSSYDVEMALTDAFDAPVLLGNSTGSSFSINVMDFNMAINSAGPENFTDQPVYLRVKAGSAVSNTVLVLVDAYPIDPATITSPSQDDAFVLDIASQDLVLFSFTWEDAALTTADNVDYTVEAALAGTDFATTIPVGAVSNANSLDVTHSDLNGVAIGLGIAPETAADIDLRIVSVTTNSSGNSYERVSDTITINVTPYNVAFPYIYLVGASTAAGWSNNNINPAVFRSQTTPNSYEFTGYFQPGGFKILENVGAWQPQWGTNDGSTLGVNPGDGSDPGIFDVPSAGYYTMSIPSLTEGASYTITAYDASAAPTYNSIGLIGQAIGGWGDADEIELIQRDPVNNPHLWYATDVAFTNGEEFLIRPNDDWNNGVWRYTGSDELFGQANLAGSGDNFPFTAPTGNYDVWFNDLDGSYVIIPN